MRSSEARQKFKLADELYRDKKYTEALTVLDKLDAAFPNAKNVMYPRAMCLAKLGRNKEAHEICQKLKAIYNDPRADQLMQKLAGSVPQAPPPVFDPNMPAGGVQFDPMDLNVGPIEGAPGGADPMGLGDMFAKPAVPPPPPPVDTGPNRTPLYIGLGVAGVVLVLALILLPLLLGGGTDTEVADSGSGAGTSQQTAAAPAGETDGIYWYNSYDTAMNASYDKSAPTLLFFYNSGSDDATRMMEETWKEPSIAHLVNGWTCVRIDTEADPDTPEWYDVTEVPTTIVDDDLRGVVFEETGYVSAQAFYKAIQPLDLQVYEMPEFTIAHVLVLILMTIFQGTFGLYLTLLMVRKLPHDEFLRDIISCLLVGTGMVYLIGACSCVGIVAAYFILKSTYEFEFLDYVAFLGINMVLSALGWVLFAAMVGLPVAETFELLQGL